VRYELTFQEISNPFLKCQSDGGVEYLNSCIRRKDGDIPKHASKLHPTFESTRNVNQAG
jgi:hypothetical protein